MSQMLPSGSGPSRPSAGGRLRWRRVWTAVAAVVIVAIYLVSLAFSLTESERRSVTLETKANGPDNVHVEIEIVSVDLMQSELTARISFEPAGKLAEDKLIPAADLRFVVNSVRGKQQFDFAKGQRINPIEVVFPVEGNANMYPFDHHKANLWLFLTLRKPAQVMSLSRPEPRIDKIPQELVRSSDLPVSAASIEEAVQADTETRFSASIPGVTFKGTLPTQSAQNLKGLTGFEVHIDRSPSVKFISVTSMAMMGALGVALVAMVMRIVARGRRLETYHIPVAVSLIFGLPALRNMQPGIPPIGITGDVVAFIWAEIAAAGSAVALVVHWLLHQTRP